MSSSAGSPAAGDTSELPAVDSLEDPLLDEPEAAELTGGGVLSRFRSAEHEAEFSALFFRRSIGVHLVCSVALIVTELWTTTLSGAAIWIVLPDLAYLILRIYCHVGVADHRLSQRLGARAWKICLVVSVVTLCNVDISLLRYDSLLISAGTVLYHQHEQPDATHVLVP